MNTGSIDQPIAFLKGLSNKSGTLLAMATVFEKRKTLLGCGMALVQVWAATPLFVKTICTGWGGGWHGGVLAVA